MAQVSFSPLEILPLSLCFFEGNFALVFFRTLGLLLPCLAGILQAKISVINQLKKGEFLPGWIVEIATLPYAQP